MRVIAAALLWVLTIALPGLSGSAAETRPQGLMWRDSPLPAVFPLQVKSHAGQDFYLRLVDVETDQAVLAAYVRGGQFFRVLVPPGTFTIRIAAGAGWQGEEKLFGPGDGTRTFDLPEKLSFGVRDFSTKGGHLIDLSTIGQGDLAAIAPLATCQTLQLRRHEDLGRLGVHRFEGTRVGALRYPGRRNVHHRDHLHRQAIRRLDRFRFDVRTSQC